MAYLFLSHPVQNSLSHLPIRCQQKVRVDSAISTLLVSLISTPVSSSLEGFGDFKMGGQIIHIVKYADDLVLLAKEEKVLQDMIDKLIEIGRCYGMEMNVEKQK